MTFLSFFTGIGGFDLGFEGTGMTCVGQIERDKTCQLVLNAHWPDKLKGNDVTTYKHAGPVPDVICGGFPCQDLSVAGKRKGLAGERSGLWFAFRDVVAGLNPRWVVIENVPGLLSSNEGRDFAVLLHGLGKLGYRFASRVLDSQYDGVAQRRRRVFIVGSLGNGRCAEVLFEPESLRWHPAPSRKKGEGITYATSPCLSASGRGTERAGESRGQDCVIPVSTNAEVVGCLSPGAHPGGLNGQDAYSGQIIAAPTVTCKWAKGSGGRSGGRSGDECQNLVTAPLTTKSHADNDGQEDKLIVMPSLVCNGDAHSGFRDEKGITVVRTAQTSSNGCGLNDNTAYTLDGTQGQAVGLSIGVRRLTPRECERLQGFTPCFRYVTLSACYDPQKNSAIVEVKCLRSLSSAFSVADIVNKEAAKFVDAFLRSGLERQDAPALVRVRIAQGAKLIELVKADGSHSFVNGAESKKWSHPFIALENFAHVIAVVEREMERITTIGKEASLQNERSFTLPSSGKWFAETFGPESAESAKDATKRRSEAITSITSSPTLSSRNLGWTEEAWLSFAIAAINSYTRGKTRDRNSSVRLLIEVETDFTHVGVNSDGARIEISDSQRYKMLGNAVTVNVANWIGKRLMLTENKA